MECRERDADGRANRADRGTVISAASQRASVWLLTRYSRGVRVRLCKGGRVEARWMLGDGAARGATPSALAKSTPSFLFSLSTRILFLPWDALLLLLPSFFFPLSLFASFVLLRFSTSFCLFPLSSFFFFTTVLPPLCVFIYPSVGCSASFLLSRLYYVLNFVILHETRGRVVRSNYLFIVRRGDIRYSRGELISSVVRRVGCCRKRCLVGKLRNGIFMVERRRAREREREKIIWKDRLYWCSRKIRRKYEYFVYCIWIKIWFLIICRILWFLI